MTSTINTVGLGGSERVSSRVLKPPGGGCADIFGVSESESQPAPRSNRQASQFTLGDDRPSAAPAPEQSAPPAEPAPAPAVECSAPAPIESSAEPAPVCVEVPAPAPAAEVSAPAPVAEESAPAPAAEESAPAPAAAPSEQPQMKQVRTSTRVRMPPGGHSTPLW